MLELYHKVSIPGQVIVPKMVNQEDNLRNIYVYIIFFK